MVRLALDRVLFYRRLAMTGIRFVLLTMVLLACPFARPVLAQEPGVAELRREIESLKEGLEGIRRDLQEIKGLLRSRAAPAEPQNVVLSVDGASFKGDKNARLTLIEFSDYQCPFCARYVRETLPQLEREYIETGKVRYVFRNFPIEAIHQDALQAAEAALCAGEQQRYWEMHDRLFAHQDTLREFSAHAKAIGLDVASFEQCLASNRQTTAVRRDLADGQRAGVRGTPSFFIGATEPGGRPVRSLRAITGAHPYATFKEAIESLLGAGN